MMNQMLFFENFQSQDGLKEIHCKFQPLNSYRFRIDGYRDYTLKVTWDKAKPGEHKICMVQRRYTDFEWLQDKLLAKMSE